MENINTAKFNFDNIIGSSETLIKCKKKAMQASKTSSPILIYGETGTGKELFVQSIHNSSQRKHMPFIAQNCAAIPTNLLEAMLFGTIKGSFTGAENKKGLFELADGGTLYLDELNSMPIEIQAKLLRVLQEGAFRRIGENCLRNVDVRIIASVNEEPEKLLESQQIRKDLFYRLNVVRIDIPPLRERKEDIPLLISSFINNFNFKFKSSINILDDKVLSFLVLRDWQGNVRELEHFIESLFNIKQTGDIQLEDLQELFADKEILKIVPLKEKMLEVEMNYIREALAATDYNISKAAKLLGIPRQTLQNKIKRLKFRL